MAVSMESASHPCVTQPSKLSPKILPTVSWTSAISTLFHVACVKPNERAEAHSCGESHDQGLRSLQLTTVLPELVPVVHESHELGLSPKASRHCCTLSLSSDQPTFLGRSHWFLFQESAAYPSLVAASLCAGSSSGHTRSQMGFQGAAALPLSTLGFSASGSFSQPRIRQCASSSGVNSHISLLRDDTALCLWTICKTSSRWQCVSTKGAVAFGGVAPRGPGRAAAGGRGCRFAVGRPPSASAPAP
mmetsp:Transcript_116503/g.340873  ORF Transcript_116503/g.340873 Transcript_116503/m.340873 type:complete len:246 (+) Transcript_116503:660-1397(+)